MSAARPVAVVSGGARGIGRATCLALAAAGHDLVVIDGCADDPRLPYPMATEDDLHATVDACTETGATAIGLVADVRSQEQLDAAIHGTREHFGALDVLVAAAGAIVGGPPAWQTDDLAWSAMLDINLTGVWRLIRAAAPVMIDTAPGRGRIVAVASAAGIGGLPQLAAYTAAKHGVVGLVRSLAQELAPHGITANAVCPGSTRTAMLDASAEVYALDSAEIFIRHQALGRLLEPDEIASAVTWLCSASASGVTGAIVPVDGGMTAT